MKVKEILYDKQWASEDWSFDYVLGEVEELMEVRSWDEFLGELCDVYSCGMMWIYCRFGIDLGIWWERSVRGWGDRVDNHWKRIFEEVGLEWNIKYISDGGNYKKIEKVKLAIRKAIEEQV